MKTLLLTLEYPPFRGGVANYYGNMAKYWPIGEKLSILDNSHGDLLAQEGIMIWLRAIPFLKRKLISEKIDYVLVGQILPLGTVTYILSLFQPLPYGVFLHGMDLALALRTPRKRFLTKLILKRADRIICANSYVREKLIEFLPELEKNIDTINPGIESGVPYLEQNDLEDIRNSYNLAGKTVLLSLGRLVKRKGVDKTIEAIAQMSAAETENLLYVITGAGLEEEYLKKLVPSDLSRKIIFLGEVNEKEKWSWLNLCDIFIMPARDISGDFEGFGIVYLEANLCGKPVIAGNTGGVRDAVLNGVTGLMVDPENTEEIKNAIIRLADDKNLRAELGQTGKARAIREFNWEKQALKIANFIK